MALALWHGAAERRGRRGRGSALGVLGTRRGRCVRRSAHSPATVVRRRGSLRSTRAVCVARDGGPASRSTHSDRRGRGPAARRTHSDRRGHDPAARFQGSSSGSRDRRARRCVIRRRPSLFCLPKNCANAFQKTMRTTPQEAAACMHALINVCIRKQTNQPRY